MPVDAAEVVWNRAALENGGSSPATGDRALADMLAFHGLVMSGGLLNAVELTPVQEQARISAAFQWFGLESITDLITSVRQEIEAGVLDEPGQAEVLELTANRDYQAILPSDDVLLAVFQRRLNDDPSAFASPVGPSDP